jgi:hypothetical protein
MGMGADYKEVGRIAISGKNSQLAGRKIAPKYRGPWRDLGRPRRHARVDA